MLVHLCACVRACLPPGEGRCAASAGPGVPGVSLCCILWLLLPTAAPAPAGGSKGCQPACGCGSESCDVRDASDAAACVQRPGGPKPRALHPEVRATLSSVWSCVSGHAEGSSGVCILR